MKEKTIEMINEILEAQQGCKPATFQVREDGQIIIIDMAPKQVQRLILKGYSLDIGAKGTLLYKF